MVLPLFAFSATSVSFDVDFSAPAAPGILAGVILGLVVGKPFGLCAAAWLAVKSRLARMPDDVSLPHFVGAAFLCGIGDTVALLMADQAFPDSSNSAVIAKIGVLVASVLAAVIGATIILLASSGASGRTAAAESN